VRIFAVANQKGGVGKTTSTVNLAAPLATMGRPTLLLDLDPHGSLTSYFGYDPDSVAKSSYQLFQSKNIDFNSLICPTNVSQLDILPANSALATLDRQLGIREGQGLVVVDALNALKNNYAYVFIDCPPVLGVLMVNALAACERLIVPVQAEFLALKGLERMLRTLTMIEQARGRELPFTIVPTMYDKRTKAARESLAILRESYPYNIWDSTIPIDTQFRESSRQGLPLTTTKPKSRGAVAYHQLLKSLLKQTYEYEQQHNIQVDAVS